MANPEFILQSQVTGYIRSQYPKVLFRSDLIALANLPVQTASMMKRMQCARGWPDLTLYETIFGQSDDIWNGLCQEIKTGRETIFNRNGSIKSDQIFHTLEQQANLSMMWARGFVGTFYFGYQDCCDAIDGYMQGKFDFDRAGEILDLCLETIRRRPEILIDERLDPFVARWYSDRLGWHGQVDLRKTTAAS